MNLLTNKIIFIKTGLLSVAILFFLGCKKEQNKIGFDDPDKLPTNTYFTDTITIKSEMVLINNAINTTNVSSDGLNSFLLAGAYTDPVLGTMKAEAYTRLSLTKEFVEIPNATADSAELYLDYSYFYGDSLQSQTLNVYKLIDNIDKNTTYYSTSPALNYDPTPIGTITFNASAVNGSSLTVKITDLPFLQSLLDASKNSQDFHEETTGIALIPANSTNGAILRIDGSSHEGAFKIFYTQYAENKIYSLSIGKNSRKFYRIVADRSSSVLSSLSNNYDSISSSLTSNQCFIQACSGIRTRISFPYLDKLKAVYPNMAIISSHLILTSTPGSTLSEKYPTNSGLVLIRTNKDESGVYKIKKDSKGTIFYVQPDDQTQSENNSVQVHPPNDDNVYSFPLKSYLQSILLGQINNDPIIISPSLLFREANRIVFNDNENPTKSLKLKIYFTATK